jgi:hypothetical protein
MLDCTFSMPFGNAPAAYMAPHHAMIYVTLAVFHNFSMMFRRFM